MIYLSHHNRKEVCVLRDMRINEKLGTLLTLLMEQSWHPESVTVSWKKMERIEIKTIWMSITIL